MRTGIAGGGLMFIHSVAEISSLVLNEKILSLKLLANSLQTETCQTQSMRRCFSEQRGLGLRGRLVQSGF